MPLTSSSSSSKWPWLSASGGWRAMDKAGCSAWRGGAGTMPPGRAEWLRGADTCLRALRAKCITAAISFVMAANPNFNGWCPSGTACVRCTQCRQTQRLRCCNHAQSTDDACWQCVGCMRRFNESGAFPLPTETITTTTSRRLPAAQPVSHQPRVWRAASLAEDCRRRRCPATAGSSCGRSKLAQQLCEWKGSFS